ncbi:MAG: 50S ribosomal protein L32 [Actinomycetota bacterium]
MAVPKRKMSKSKSRSRKASAWRTGRTARSICPQCGAPQRPHRACAKCGYYAGRQVLDLD